MIFALMAFSIIQCNILYRFIVPCLYLIVQQQQKFVLQRLALCMGTHQSFGLDPTLHSKPIDTQPLFTIYQSPSGQQFQKYEVIHDNTSNFELNYQFRMQNKHDHLVDVVYAGPIHSFMGCAERCKYEVVTERIPYLLESLGGIRVGNALVILNASLRGFRDLRRRHGIIDIKENMIGINSENRVKVWLNENFAVNRPEETEEAQGEKNMVDRIFQMVALKSEKTKLWGDLLLMKAQNNPVTFDEAVHLLQEFVRRRQIHIDESVVNIFNKSYFQQRPREHQLIEAIQTENSQFFTSPVRKPFEEMQEKILESKTSNYNFTLAKHDNVEFHSPSVVHRNVFSSALKMDEHRQLHTPVFHNPLPLNTERVLVRNPQSIQIKFNTKAPEPVHAIPIFSSTNTNAIKSKEIEQSVIIVQKQQQRQGSKLNVGMKTIQTSESANAFPPNTNLKENAVTVPTFSAIPTQQHSNITPNQPQSQHPDTSFEKEQDQGYTEPQSPKMENQQVFITLNNAEYVRVEPSYEINEQEVLSEQSLHEQLTPLLADESIPQIKQTFQEQGKTALHVYLRNREASLQHLQSIRTSLNPSLVDTREIKQEENAIRKTEPSAIPPPKSGNISYREMRRLLLEHLQ